MDVHKLDNIDKALKCFAAADVNIEMNRNFLLQKNFKMVSNDVNFRLVEKVTS